MWTQSSISVWNLFDLVICLPDHEQFLTSVQPHPAARSGAHHRHANAGASKKWNANQTCNANKKTARSPTPLHAVAPTTDTQMLAPPKDGMPTNNAMPI